MTPLISDRVARDVWSSTLKFPDRCCRHIQICQLEKTKIVEHRRFLSIISVWPNVINVLSDSIKKKDESEMFIGNHEYFYGDVFNKVKSITIKWYATRP